MTHLVLLYLCSLLSFTTLPGIIMAQNTGIQGPSITQSCTYSCPKVDAMSQPLVKRPNTVGYNSFYSVFECMYPTSNSRYLVHKCTYDKATGVQRLGYASDNCPANAIPCVAVEGDSKSGSAPMFSNQEKDETPPWVEGGRYLLYLKEHRGP